MSLSRVRAVFGVDMQKVPAVIGRAEAMDSGFASDPATYANPTPPPAAFKTLITNATTAQTGVRTRAVRAATRDVQVRLRIGGTESWRLFNQDLADANPARAIAIIQNGGLVVAQSSAHTKLLLVLRDGAEKGSVVGDANVGLLIGADAKHPRAG